MRFPDAFLWGAATSAHQVEGNNVSSDWWAWENDATSPVAERSGDAVDHYHRFADDISLLADLGLNAYRFSVEWARVEPERGYFSRAVLDHYRRVLATCLEHGVTPVVTWHHFTNPKWMVDAGGWCSPQALIRFARFVDVATRALGDLIEWHCTINEINLVPSNTYTLGGFPGGRVMDATATQTAGLVLGQAHRSAADVIKSGPGNPKVGLTLAVGDLQPVDGGETRAEQEFAANIAPYLALCDRDDFVGVQTYSRSLIGPEGPRPAPAGAETTQMGWEYYPRCLVGSVARIAAASGKPILVTENGIATSDDSRRSAYVREAIAGLGEIVDGGVDVRGYFHWSLLDNFEWNVGWRPTFGLVAVDRTTMQRTVKDSARVYGEIARANGTVLR